VSAEPATARQSIARPLTPPRGWNSWDCFGPAVTEAEVLANARFMAEHMLAFGWDTVVVDIQWYEPNARAGGYNDDADVVLDGYGRPVPTLNRFPSAAGGRGFKPLADQVHALGLKLGLHIMRGVPRRAAAASLPLLGTSSTIADIADPGDPCAWNTDNWGIDWAHRDAERYYASLADLFASWDLDFVKADDMLFPYHARDIEVLSSALAGTGRDIVLSLSPGIDGATPHGQHVASHAAMWRISGDLWDRWVDVYKQFELMARWAPVSAPGAWADADMLPLGHIGIRAERGEDRMSLLTAAEQRTMMTLWSIARSPLMVGGDLPTSGPDTLALLTNAAVLDVNAHATGSRQVLRDEHHIVWSATLDGDQVVAVFAIGDDPIDVVVDLAAIGIGDVSGATDLWSGDAALVAEGGLRVRLAAHDACLVRFTA
jgi:alpha-galactosidase